MTLVLGTSYATHEWNCDIVIRSALWFVVLLFKGTPHKSKIHTKTDVSQHINAEAKKSLHAFGLPMNDTSIKLNVFSDDPVTCTKPLGGCNEMLTTNVTMNAAQHM